MKRLVTAAVVGLLLAGGAAVVDRADSKTLTATFPRTTSLYEGARVKVLGVEVGNVESIYVKGTAVEVTISYDGDVKLPADVHAVIVPPSIVGDRFVQLAPAYESGPVLADAAALDLARSEVPMELDEVYSSFDDLASALGPQGANKNGALSRLIAAAADSLQGRGQLFNQTIREMSQAVSTLAGSSESITGTVDNLSVITRTLAGKDAQMRRLVTNLAAVATTLNGQSDSIHDAVTSLRTALRDVSRFVSDHRSELTRTVSGLTHVTDVLNRHSRELAYLLDLAPVGLTSLGNIYVSQNWDPTKPGSTPVGAREGSLANRSATWEQLDVQLSYALSALCSNLPAAQQARLASFCTTLRSIGSLGTLVTQLGRGELSPSPATLDELLGGAQ